jgi:hypothetical protein
MFTEFHGGQLFVSQAVSVGNSIFFHRSTAVAANKHNECVTNLLLVGVNAQFVVAVNGIKITEAVALVRVTPQTDRWYLSCARPRGHGKPPEEEPIAIGRKVTPVILNTLLRGFDSKNSESVVSRGLAGASADMTFELDQRVIR